MKAYNLNIDMSFFIDYNSVKNKNRELKNDEKSLRKKLSEIINNQGEYKASDIEATWFPQKEIDVFISHSHKYKEIAIKLADWLHDKFQLNSFVDSSILGYSAELKKEIDDKYSVQRINNNGSSTYDYNKSRNSTTHVNMILSGALLKMIDNSKAVFFINTPNSINSPEESTSQETYSPWIYLELLFTHFIIEREKTTKKARDEFTMVHDSEEKFKISFDIKKDHLINLNRSMLKGWEMEYSINNSNDPLSLLFEFSKRQRYF